MSAEWVKIYSAANRISADLARQILADEAIMSFVVDKQDSSYLFGEVEILVKPVDAIRAVNILKDSKL